MSNPQTSMMSPINFGFILDKTPDTNYMVQRVTFPGMQMGLVTTPAQGLARIINSGNIDYGNLEVQFKVGENMSDYLEIWNWMIQLGHPDSLTQYSRETHDAAVIILDSAKRPIVRVRFTDVLPVALTPITLDTSLTNISYVDATVSLAFQRYYIEPL